MSFRAIPIFLAGTMCACAATDEYVYQPEQPTVNVGGAPAQQYAVPPEAPTGNVRVASTGIVEMRGQDGRQLRAIHIRMIADDEGDPTPWMVDASQARLQIASIGEARPMFVNTDQGGPQITVDQHQRRVVDFYFPPPDGVTSNERLPAFDFLWTVRTPTRAVSERTSFTREKLSPPPSEAELYTGWGPVWWYNPWYPSLWSGPRFIVVHPHFEGGYHGGFHHR
jgi:hypothetical protein